MTTPYQDDAFWFSKISTARQCLRLYKLKHLDKLPEPGEKSADLEFGSAMHLAINAIMEGSDGLRVFGMYWDSVGAQSLAYGRLDHIQLYDCGEVLLTRFQRLHAKHFEPFKMEERIFTEFGEHDDRCPGGGTPCSCSAFKVEGTPDFLGKYKGVPSVVDFKTAGYRYDKRRIICDEQMAGYAAMAEKAYGYRAEQCVYIVLIKDPKAPSIQTIEYPLTDSRLSSTILNMTETCDDLKTRSTFPMNTSHCIRGTMVCSFFEKCHGSQKEGE